MNITTPPDHAAAVLRRDGQPRRRVRGLWALLPALACASSLTQSGGPLTGDLTLTVKGQGSFDDGTIKATWNVNRVARATVLLDRMFRGGGIAGTRDTRNTERYETWVANRSQPAHLDIDDSGEFDGPLFHSKTQPSETARHGQHIRPRSCADCRVRTTWGSRNPASRDTSPATG